MGNTFTAATFNVENLFGRAEVLNLKDYDSANEVLAKIAEFRKLIGKPKYTSHDKEQMVNLFNQDLRKYIEVREDRGRLFAKKGWAVVGVKADGAGDWDGAIEFKRADFSEMTRENTAKVIKDIRAEVVCVVEAESRPILESFDAQLLGSRYLYEMLIDGNDPRGIDVGIYSKYPLGGVWTHVFDKVGRSTVFSRDCLEAQIFLPNGRPLYMLCNHFKSRGYDFDGKSSEKRTRQAKRVVEILAKYDLTSDWVIVAGDFNDSPNSPPLQPLLTVDNLYDVLSLQFPADSAKRWTYHYKEFEQIDFILVSKPLREQMRKAGVERRGMYDLKRMTSSSKGLVEVEEEYKTVTHWTNAASDHAAVWAEFSF